MRIRSMLLTAAVVGLAAIASGVEVRGQETPPAPETAAPRSNGTTATRAATPSPTARGGRGGTSSGIGGGSFGAGGGMGGMGGMGGGGGGISSGVSDRGGMQPSPPVMGEGPTCSLDATIYDVHLPVEQISRLDLGALTRAAGSAADFEKTLGDLGSVKPLYRADQSVRLSGDSINIGAQVPYITNSQLTNTGQTINSVAYTHMGAIFSVMGKTGGGADNIALNLDIQMSTLADGGVPISTNVKAPLFRTVTLTHKGTVTAKQPFVVMSADATNVDDKGKAVAYIARVVLGAPQADVTPARAP